MSEGSSGDEGDILRSTIPLLVVKPQRRFESRLKGPDSLLWRNNIVEIHVIKLLSLIEKNIAKTPKNSKFCRKNYKTLKSNSIKFDHKEKLLKNEIINNFLVVFARTEKIQIRDFTFTLAKVKIYFVISLRLFTVV